MASYLRFHFFFKTNDFNFKPLERSGKEIVKLYKDGKLFGTMNESTNFTYKFKNVTTSLTGNFVCVASNDCSSQGCLI